jgi:hypothetical protein
MVEEGLNSLESSQDDFEIEQKDIVDIVKGKERRTQNVAVESRWNRFDGDITCRVVKQFLKKHLPDDLKVVGPNAYIDGYPVEFDLLLVTHSAIPAAFTNAYRDNEVHFVIEVKNRGDMDRTFLNELFHEFEILRNSYKHVKCTCLMIDQALNNQRTSSMSHVEESKKAVEPEYRVFCLAQSGTHEIISGQWRDFVNHVVPNRKR